MYWILNPIEKSIYNNLVLYSKAFDVWVDLRQTYCKIDVTRILCLLQEISRTTQGINTVFVYYMKLILLWDEYSTLKYATKCSCVAAIDIAYEEQTVRLMQFLMGLNDVYSMIRSNMLMTSLLPTMMHAYNIVY